MRLEDLFNVTAGNKLDFNKMTLAGADDDSVVFVGRGGTANGVVGRVEKVAGAKTFPAGSMTVALGGTSRLATFIQDEPFYTAQNVVVLTPKKDMSVEEKIYWALCIKANRYKYTAFGREANRTIRDLSLPDSPPEFVSTTTLPTLVPGVAAPSSVELGPISGWSSFKISALFDIERGKPLNKRDQQPGSTPYVGASDRNNGVTTWVARKPDYRKNRITIAYDGSVGATFLQPEAFCVNEKVVVLTEKAPVPVPALMFTCVMIRAERFRYSYGRKWNIERMTDSEIRLPVDAAGNPDWHFMEEFMNARPFSDVALATES